jgi:hypothetical protein
MGLKISNDRYMKLSRERICWGSIISIIKVRDLVLVWLFVYGISLICFSTILYRNELRDNL